MGLMGVLIGFAVIVLVAGCAAYYLLRRAILNIKAEASEAIGSFVSPGPEGSPSQLALVVRAMSAIVAGEITVSLKTSLMGQASGIARSLDGAQQDVVLDGIAHQSPVLSALLEFSPSLRKRIGKMSPLATMALSQMASGLKLGGSPVNGKVAKPMQPSMGL